MKVCTDACLFGAYVASVIVNEELAVNKCLDIGAGTGLLSLMVAQKISGHIDAVEIDEAAYQQAGENFAESPWKDRLKIFHASILDFGGDKKYDCIISNPPFFEGDLKSDSSIKNAAKHGITLTLQQLLNVVKDHLKDDGFFAVLLPFHRLNYCIDEALKLDFHLLKKILVKQTHAHNYFRTVLFFKTVPSDVYSEEIIIKNELGAYTEMFVGLLKDYYLFL